MPHDSHFWQGKKWKRLWVVLELPLRQNYWEDWFDIYKLDRMSPDCLNFAIFIILAEMDSHFWLSANEQL